MLAHILGDLYHERTRFQRIRSATFEDVADYIAVGVGVTVFRLIPHIGAHRLRAAQPGAFADEQDHHVRFDEFADVIHHPDAGILDKEGRAQRQTGALDTLLENRENLAQVRFNGCGGEPIPNNKLNIYILLALLVDEALGIVVEQTSEIRAKQIFLFTACYFRLNREQIEFIQEFLVNIAKERILSHRVIALEEEQ